MSAEYGYDDSRIEPKTCPLTEEKVWPENSYICFHSDCSLVSKTQRYYLYGRTYRCQWERQNIVEWHERQEKAAEIYKRLNKSLETARKIDIDEFYAYCDSLDAEMINTRQKVGRDMMINPYHDSEEKCLIYLFENDEVVEISTVENGEYIDPERSIKERIEPGSLDLRVPPGLFFIHSFSLASLKTDSQLA